MRAGGAVADEQAVGDFAVRASQGHQAEHLALAGCQTEPRSEWRSLLPFAGPSTDEGCAAHLGH